MDKRTDMLASLWRAVRGVHDAIREMGRISDPADTPKDDADDAPEDEEERLLDLAIWDDLLGVQHRLLTDIRARGDTRRYSERMRELSGDATATTDHG